MKHCLLTGCGLFALLASSPFAGGGDDKELEKFRGTWNVVAMEAGGQKAPEENVKKVQVQLIFEGNKYTEKVQGKMTEDGTFKIDAKKEPRFLDLSIQSGKDKGKTQLAIYKFEGDRLFVALSVAGSETRPDGFITKADSEFAVHVLAREKPAKAEAK